MMVKNHFTCIHFQTSRKNCFKYIYVCRLQDFENWFEYTSTRHWLSYTFVFWSPILQQLNLSIVQLWINFGGTYKEVKSKTWKSGAYHQIDFSPNSNMFFKIYSSRASRYIDPYRWEYNVFKLLCCPCRHRIEGENYSIQSLIKYKIVYVKLLRKSDKLDKRICYTSAVRQSTYLVFWLPSYDLKTKEIL